MLILQLLLLLLIANGAPILARKLFHGRFYTPLDHGRLLADGRPVFGPSKTLRGMVAAISLTMLVAPQLGFSLQIGILIGVAAMAGDLLSSFVKRRLGLAPSSRAPGLDQIPESLLPLLLVMPVLSLTWWEIAAVVVLFLVTSIVLSRLLFLIGIRKQPH